MASKRTLEEANAEVAGKKSPISRPIEKEELEYEGPSTSDGRHRSHQGEALSLNDELTSFAGKRSEGITEPPPLKRTCNCESEVKKLILDEAEGWGKRFKDDMEKTYAEITEIVRKKQMVEMENFGKSLFNTLHGIFLRSLKRLHTQYAAKLAADLEEVKNRNKEELEVIKTKKWCCVCESEARYHCCRFTFYCSSACQRAHWNEHKNVCFRRKPVT